MTLHEMMRQLRDPSGWPPAPPRTEQPFEPHDWQRVKIPEPELLALLTRPIDQRAVAGDHDDEGG